MGKLAKSRISGRQSRFPRSLRKGGTDCTFISMRILFSIYAILCLRGAFGNLTKHITEKGLYKCRWLFPPTRHRRIWGGVGGGGMLVPLSGKITGYYLAIYIF